MSNIFKKIVGLIQKGKIRISNHGYNELAEDGILVRDIMAGVKDGLLTYLLEDAEKLDDVRAALRREDIEAARKLSKVYRLTPVN